MSYIFWTTSLFVTAALCGTILGETHLGFWLDMMVVFPFAFVHSLMCTHLFGDDRNKP